MNQAKVRRQCFEANKQADARGHIYLVCHLCKGVIEPGREPWEADHVIARSIGGGDGGNVLPAHKRCHDQKTHETDTPRAAKVKRVRDKHNGIERKSGFRRVAGVKFNWKTGRNEAIERIPTDTED